jgi:DNA polymerase eta
MNEGKFQLQPDKLKNTFAFGYESFGNFILNVSKCHDPYSEDMELSEIEKRSILRSGMSMLLAASIVNEIRNEVKLKTTFECSAGIAHNKILAKLACGLNKPNKQTLLPLNTIPKLFETLPVSKVKGLGAKLGKTVCETLNIQFMGELSQFSERELIKKIDEKNGKKLYWLARGVDLEQVSVRFIPKSIGSSKRFPGKNAITGLKTLNHWLTELSDELVERLNKDAADNNRHAKLLVVQFTLDTQDHANSRSIPLAEYNIEKIAKDAVDTIKNFVEVFLKPGSTALVHPIKFLGLSASKFEESKKVNPNSSMKTYLKTYKKKEKVAGNESTDESLTEEPKPGCSKDFFAKFRAPKKQEILVNEKKVDEKNEESLEHQEQHLEEKNQILLSDDENSDQDQKEKENQEPNQIKDPVLENDDLDRKSDDEDIFGDLGDVDAVEDEAIVDSQEELPPTNSSRSRPNKNQISAIENKLDDPEDDLEEMEKSFLCYPEEEEEDPRDHQNRPKENEYPAPAPDYTKSYAEFHLPEVIEKMAFEVCEKCNKRIPLSEVITHYDQHLAFQLANQMREEYRSQISKPSKQVEAKKLVKAKSSPKVVLKVAPITKFLSQKEPSSKAEDDDQSKVKCDQCNTLIPSEKLAEHLDFHFAQKIRMENCEILSSQPSVKNDKGTKNPKKRPSDQNCSNSAKQFKAFFKSDFS